MKGMVFTEFIELVEDKFSPELADQLIVECDLPSGGAYTSVGSYDHNEIVELVALLSDKSSVPVKDLLIVFGEHLIGRFSQLYPQMFEPCENLFDFLQTIHNHVHVEVRKLYPDAELPDLLAQEDGDVLTMEYDSTRPFSDLAYGLIKGAIVHFNENIDLKRESDGSDLLNKEIFTLVRVH